jgi:hypothetical protein
MITGAHPSLTILKKGIRPPDDIWENTFIFFAFCAHHCI